MAKNILVITGSPRKNGNSGLMADAFIEGAKKNGHTVKKFDAGHSGITGCQACGGCWSKGKPCLIDDGFNDNLAPLLERAEVIVFSTPLYFFGFTAQLKAVVDRMYSFIGKNREKLPARESILLICCHDEEEGAMGGAIESYNQIVKYMKWFDRGIVSITGVGARGEILHTGAPDACRLLGENI